MTRPTAGQDEDDKLATQLRMACVAVSSVSHPAIAHQVEHGRLQEDPRLDHPRIDIFVIAPCVMLSGVDV